MPSIDVEDCAKAHLNCLASNRVDLNYRYILAKESIWMKDIINIIKKEEKVLEKQIKTKIIPKWMLGIA